MGMPYPQLVQTQVVELIKEHIGSDVVILLENDLQEDFNIDSIELVEIGLKLEKSFTIELPDDGVRHCTTVLDVVQKVLQAQQNLPSQGNQTV